MSASTQTASTIDRADSSSDQAMVPGARWHVGAAIETLRSTAVDAGDRMPGLIEGVRAGAAEGARTIEAWPEPTRRLVAAFSLGLGAGLTIAGAPRVLVGGALVPAMVVAATSMRQTEESAKPV